MELNSSEVTCNIWVRWWHFPENFESSNSGIVWLLIGMELNSSDFPVIYECNTGIFPEYFESSELSCNIWVRYWCFFKKIPSVLILVLLIRLLIVLELITSAFYCNIQLWFGHFSRNSESSECSCKIQVRC